MYNGYGFEQPDFSGVGSLAPQGSPLNLNIPKVKRGGMFGNADWGSAISAALNGYLAAGGNPAGIAGLQQLHRQRMYQQEQAASEQEYQRERTDKNADWMTQYNYELAHPKPGAPDAMTQHMIAAGIDPNSPQGQAYYRASLDPVVQTAQGPMTRSQLLGLPAPQGVTFTPIDEGDASGNAGGGFPGY